MIWPTEFAKQKETKNPKWVNEQMNNTSSLSNASPIESKLIHWPLRDSEQNKTRDQTPEGREKEADPTTSSTNPFAYQISTHHLTWAPYSTPSAKHKSTGTTMNIMDFNSDAKYSRKSSSTQI